MPSIIPKFMLRRTRKLRKQLRQLSSALQVLALLGMVIGMGFGITSSCTAEADGAATAEAANKGKNKGRSKPHAGAGETADANADAGDEDPHFIKGRVVKVHDGDTITILTNSQREQKVRMHGIDAPEHGQPYGNAAKEMLSNAIYNREVTVQPMERDRYGRLLGYVYYNSRNVNYDMVAWGMAWHYARYSDDERFAEAQRVASQQRRGLWQQREKAVPPWDWRHARERR